MFVFLASLGERWRSRFAPDPEALASEPSASVLLTLFCVASDSDGLEVC